MPKLRIALLAPYLLAGLLPACGYNEPDSYNFTGGQRLAKAQLSNNTLEEAENARATPSIKRYPRSRISFPAFKRMLSIRTALPA